jgi:hypothetical protein
MDPPQYCRKCTNTCYCAHRWNRRSVFTPIKRAGVKRQLPYSSNSGQNTPLPNDQSILNIQNLSSDSETDHSRDDDACALSVSTPGITDHDKIYANSDQLSSDECSALEDISRSSAWSDSSCSSPEQLEQELIQIEQNRINMKVKMLELKTKRKRDRINSISEGFRRRILLEDEDDYESGLVWRRARFSHLFG